jgi:hypothetical protein
MISVPEPTTKSEVVEDLMGDASDLPDDQKFGRLSVLAVTRSGEAQHEKFEKCVREGCRPFKKCLVLGGEKDKGCATCLRFWYEHGRDDRYKCSFQT